jgi:hypothetical protein
MFCAGVPNSGKSEWLDALCMNLAMQAGWSIAMCSFEKNPKGHARNLLEKYVGKQFGAVSFQVLVPRGKGGCRWNSLSTSAGLLKGLW